MQNNIIRSGTVKPSAIISAVARLAMQNLIEYSKRTVLQVRAKRRGGSTSKTRISKAKSRTA